MACEIFTTLAITATLLGSQGLKLESQTDSSKSGLCREDEVEVRTGDLPNAVMVLKNAEGESVYEAKIRVATALFYDYGHDANEGHDHGLGGAVPEKAATFLFKYPRTSRTLTAAKIELRFFDGTYTQTAALRAPKKNRFQLKLGMR